MYMGYLTGRGVSTGASSLYRCARYMYGVSHRVGCYYIRRKDTMTRAALRAECQDLLDSFKQSGASISHELRHWQDTLTAGEGNAEEPSLRRLEQPRSIMERLKNEAVER